MASNNVKGFDDYMPRNCEKETVKPVFGNLIGAIPEWLEGELIRVGPGIWKIGDCQYDHIFDGLAIIHKFTIKNGKAFYQNRTLKSDTYKKNMEANRIVVTEFGTRAHPDPCETLFGRIKSDFKAFTSLFTKPDGGIEITDNCSVNMGYHGDQLCAMTESNFVRRVDPETLETLGERTNISDYVAVNTASAHPHVLEDGTIINVGNIFRNAKGPHYGFIKVPPSYNSEESNFKNAKLIAEIPSRWKLHPGYFHSFGITDSGKLIFLEQPFCLNVMGIALGNIFLKRSFSEWMKWYPQEKTRFHVISMKDGKVHPITYETDKLFVFHHVNAYEENDELIVDVAGYSDAEWVCRFGDIKTMKTINVSDKLYEQASARRYVLPLNVDRSKSGENLVKTVTKATAILRKGKQHNIIDLTPHHLTKDALDLPRINYKFNGRKYKFFYGLEPSKSTKNNDFGMATISKVNVITGEKICWTADENSIASEPTFVPDPTKLNAEEDDGVILSVLLFDDKPTAVSLLILDARDFKEIGRAEFTALGTVSSSVHGQWAQAGTTTHTC